MKDDLFKDACWNIIQDNMHHIFSKYITVTGTHYTYITGTVMTITKAMGFFSFFFLAAVNAYLKALRRAEPNYAKREKNANDCDKRWRELYFVFIWITGDFTPISQTKQCGEGMN